MVTGLLLRDQRGQLRRVGDPFAADALDHVTDAQTGAGRRAAGHGAGDLRAAAAIARVGRAGLHAEVRALDRPTLLEDREDLTHGVRRHGEPDPDVALRAA